MRTADISVVIANRNHARCLPRALDAVLTQSLPAREIIVIDDQSTDESASLLERYGGLFPSLRLVKNETHLGVTSSFNRGFALATSAYIVPAAADDYLLPGFFAQAMAELQRYPRAGICLAHGSCTAGDDGPLVVNDPGWSERPIYLSPEEVCQRVWHGLPVSANVIRRDALVEVGGFRPELAWYSDWFANLVIAFRHGVIHIPATLGIHVLNAGSYETNRRPGAENVRILGELIRLLVAPEFRDIALYFRRNGAACHFGPDLIRAAAQRPDARDSHVLGLLCGFAPGVYEQLAVHDPDANVRELAAIFLQQPWCELIERRADLEAENRRLIEEIQLTRLRVAPPGVLLKIRWAARLARRRLRRVVGLHPAGRFR